MDIYFIVALGFVIIIMLIYVRTDLEHWYTGLPIVLSQANFMF